jgi:UDP-sugar pyrophosphorylase
VNPKYADAERTLFKAPTRLECMMQDYPALLTSKGRVGFTSFEPWFCFSPAKNNIKDASLCAAKGLPSYGMAEAEYDFYNWILKILELLGTTQIERQPFALGINLEYGPKILLDPTFALTFEEIKNKMGGLKSISKISSLVLKGKYG